MTIKYTIWSKFPELWPTIEYGVHQTQVGLCFLAVMQQKICYLGFPQPGSEQDVLKELTAQWKEGAEITLSRENTGQILKSIDLLGGSASDSSVEIILKGTEFQIKVWQALLNIRKGNVSYYQKIAHNIGHPQATRAVAGAIGANNIAYLIPCHRVIKKSGDIHGYRWGQEIKRKLLSYECV